MHEHHHLPHDHRGPLGPGSRRARRGGPQIHDGDAARTPDGIENDGPQRRGRGGPGGRGRGPGFGPGFTPGRGFPGARGRGRGGAPDAPDAGDAAGWFSGRLPGDWFVGAPEVSVDRDEIVVAGELAPLSADERDAAATAAAEAGRIARFREDTRAQRIEIARQAQFRYGREISWGAFLGGTREYFTTASVPVMTRLRQPERQILDTLVDSGVARSRSDALVWAVRLVGEHTQEWLGELRSAMEEVGRVRDSGPDLG